MSMFKVVCKKKVTFFEIVCKLRVKVLPRFGHRANWDSESRFETASGPVSTPQIQWKSHI